MGIKTKLRDRLEYVNAAREARMALAREVMSAPDLLPHLLEIGLERHDGLGSRACWVVEFVCRERMEAIYPHLEPFTAGLGGLRAESSIRPMAKVCELLATAYYKPGSSAKRPPLGPVYRERIAGACFDWLIGPHKVAPQAYSMKTLYLLGQDYPWIRPELRAVLEQHYAGGSAAYKARARHILGWMEKSP